MVKSVDMFIKLYHEFDNILKKNKHDVRFQYLIWNRCINNKWKSDGYKIKFSYNDITDVEEMFNKIQPYLL